MWCTSLYSSLKPHKQNMEYPNATPSYLSLIHTQTKSLKYQNTESWGKHAPQHVVPFNPYESSKFNLFTTIHQQYQSKEKTFANPTTLKGLICPRNSLWLLLLKTTVYHIKHGFGGGKHWWTTIRYGFNLWGMHGLARIFLAVLLKATTCSKRETTNKSGIEVKLRFSFLSFSARDMCQTMSTNARASLYIFRTIMYLLTNPHPSIKVIKVLFLIINFPYVFRLETNIIHLLVHFRWKPTLSICLLLWVLLITNNNSHKLLVACVT